MIYIKFYHFYRYGIGSLVLESFKGKIMSPTVAASIDPPNHIEFVSVLLMSVATRHWNY